MNSLSLSDSISDVVARLLWRHGAIDVRPDTPFQLASGNYAPIYVNCRLLLSYPATVDLITASFHHYCDELEISPDCVAGGETAGIAFGAWVAQRLNKPFVYVRKKPKGYGTGSRIEGRPTGEVLLVEDMVTDGGSKAGFIDGIRDAGCRVRSCLVVFDRLQGAEEHLRKRGVELRSLVNIRTCLDVGVREGLFSADARRAVDEYFEDQGAWHAKRGLPYVALES